MKTRAAVREKTLKATGIALAVVLGAWSIPVLAATGISTDCPEADTLPTLVATTSATIAADTEEADEKSEAAEDKAAEEATPAKTVTTRMPGVSDSILPSFRRQMLRTDI